MKPAKLFLLGFAFSLLPLASGQSYRLDLIPTFDGGYFNSATSVNSSGDVVGSCYIGNDDHAFLYSGGVLTDLGSFGGHDTVASAINDAGQIVGITETAQQAQRAFLYEAGVMHDLGTLGGGNSGARAINSQGMVTGFAWTGGEPSDLAFRYSNGVMTGTGNLNGDSNEGTGINDAGVVVGVSSHDVNSQIAFYDDGVNTVSLGTLGGDHSLASGINNHNVIVGGSLATNGGLLHAFSYSGGVMTDLGTLDGNYSDALAINDAGQIVGRSTYGRNSQHAFLYSDGLMRDLNDLTVNLPSQWHLEWATSISQNGYITVTVRDAQNNNVGAGLLTPVPEPATLAVLAAGALALLARRRT
ncbi:MAG TPA: PEP-CTERM sorting domain-containing protein [Fimbriimonadaceae bacterium]|nr:PEP-CTERM sorting domain-containing protein [Fimbriimonadaceae bacterium]